MNGNLDIVKILVENGAEVDMEVDSNDGDTAIVFAAKKGHLDIVEYLIENHAKVDRLFSRGLNRFIRLDLNDTKKNQRNEEEDCRTWENIDGASPLFASGTIHKLRNDKRIGMYSVSTLYIVQGVQNRFGPKQTLIRPSKMHF